MTPPSPSAGENREVVASLLRHIARLQAELRDLRVERTQLWAEVEAARASQQRLAARIETRVKATLNQAGIDPRLIGNLVSRWF